MTIISVIDPRLRQERGWDDPGYPLGIWEAGGTVLGNASGGTRSVQIDLMKAVNAQRGLAWSLEALSVVDTDAVAKTIRLLISNMEAAVQGAANNWALPLISTNDASSVVLPLNATFALPIFLGKAIVDNVASGLLIRAANVNGEVISITARGYMWSPRAVLMGAGGYRRPVDGMFAR